MNSKEHSNLARTVGELMSHVVRPAALVSRLSDVVSTVVLTIYSPVKIDVRLTAPTKGVPSSSRQRPIRLSELHSLCFVSRLQFLTLATNVAVKIQVLLDDSSPDTPNVLLFFFLLFSFPLLFLINLKGLESLQLER